jgi:hypothetical protein
MVFPKFQTFSFYEWSARELKAYTFSVTPVMKLVKSLASVYYHYTSATFVFVPVQSSTSLKCLVRVSSSADSFSAPQSNRDQVSHENTQKNLQNLRNQPVEFADATKHNGVCSTALFNGSLQDASEHHAW